MIYVDNDSTYSQRIYIPRNDDFDGATGHTITLQSKDYTINQNGLTRIHPDAGFDGISGGTIGVYVSAATGVTFENLEVTENGRYVATGDSVYTGVTVNVPERYDEGYHDGFEAGYSSGYTEGSSDGYDSGYTEGYASGSTDGFNSGYTSGSTDGFASGYTSGMTDGYSEGYASGSTDGYTSGYTSGSTDGYSSGYTAGFDAGYSSGRTDGIEYQKSLLTDLTATTNGVYTSETGYSGVTVDLNLASVEGHMTDNGIWTWRASDFPNFEGADIVTVDVNVDMTPAYNSGYTSGVTDGYASGVTHQQSLLSDFTATTNGVFTSQTGYSAVTVDVAQTGSTNMGSITATTNNNYTPASYGYDGFSAVTVDVPIISGLNTGISSAGVYLYKASDFGNYEGFKQIEVSVDTTQAFNDGYTSGVTDCRIYACRAIYNITRDNQTVYIYDGANANIANIHINELGVDTTSNRYTFVSAGTYTLDYYTESTPYFYIGGDYLTEIHFKCNTLDHVRILVTQNVTACTFDNQDLTYIPYSFFADGAQHVTIPSITIPDNVYDIGARAFQNNDIASVVIGENVWSIGYKAFYANHNLSSIRSKNIYTPDLGSMVFDQVASTGTLYVPTGSDYSSWMAALPSGWTKVYY